MPVNVFDLVEAYPLLLHTVYPASASLADPSFATYLSPRRFLLALLQKERIQRAQKLASLQTSPLLSQQGKLAKSSCVNRSSFRGYDQRLYG